jgi:hypothetical protein
MRHCRTYPGAKHPLHRGSSIPNKSAAEWIRAKYPELVCLSGFPKHPETGYLDSSWLNIDVPPLDELPLAYMQCFNENYHLKERNLSLEKENRRLEKELSKWGRPKRM